LHRGDRRQVDLARAGEPGTVPRQRQADATGDAIPLGAQRRPGHDPGAFASDARRVMPGAQVLVLAGLGRSLEDLLAGDAVAQDLAGRRRVARDVDVHAPDVERAHAQRLGDPVEVRLSGELRLWRTEPTEGAVRWRVRARRAGTDPDVRAAIRSARVD